MDKENPVLVAAAEGNGLIAENSDSRRTERPDVAVGAKDDSAMDSDMVSHEDPLRDSAVNTVPTNTPVAPTPVGEEESTTLGEPVVVTPANTVVGAEETLPADEPTEAGDAVGEYSMKEIREAVVKVLTSDNVESMSKRIVREKIEEMWNLSRDALKKHRIAINLEIEKRLKEMQQPGEEEQQSVTEEESSGPKPSPAKRPRKAAPKARQKVARRRKPPAQSDGSSSAASVSESSAEVSEDESASDSEPPPPKRRAKSKAASVKKQQNRMMTKAMFMDKAATFEANLGDLKVNIVPREFSTGSMGWGYNGKMDLPIGDTRQIAKCQVSMNITIIGSKEWKEGKRNKEE